MYVPIIYHGVDDVYKRGRADLAETTISGSALRARIKRLGVTYTEAADLLGLTRDGLNKQMNDTNPVGRQTVLLLDCLEKLRIAAPEPRVAGSDPGHRTLALRGTPVRRRR